MLSPFFEKNEWVWTTGGDLLCAARTALNESWRKPVERIMSIVNFGLQSVGIMRKEMPAEAEKALKHCNSLKWIWSVGDSFKTEVAQSVKATVDLLSDIMRKLKLNGKKFEVETACYDDEFESFWEILHQIESSLSPDDTTRDKIRDMASLQEFISHCQLRYYTFCIKKCREEGCKVCKPVRMEKEGFEKLRFLPDPQCKTMATTYLLQRPLLLTPMNKIALHLMKRKQQSLCPLVQVYSTLEIQTQWFSVMSAPYGILCFLSGNCQLQLVEPCRKFWKTSRTHVEHHSMTCGSPW